MELGRLQKIDVREVWAHEATSFTPWLANEQNLRLLGEAIDLELELEAQEQNVGPFRADILCKDLATGHWVLIENQLERTDHSHLGQLITYAAGLGAATIVWIANPFIEEHRAALDWLNSITDSRFNFFGLEIEVWRIGDSLAAPKFNVVCKPNDWSKTVSASAARVDDTPTDTQSLQLRYWTAFHQSLKDKKLPFRIVGKPSPQNWAQFTPFGRPPFTLRAIISTKKTHSSEANEVRAEINIEGSNARQLFALLEADKHQIEAELGFNLRWYAGETAKICRISAYRSATIQDESDWQQQHAWLIEHLERMHRVFNDRVRYLASP